MRQTAAVAVTLMVAALAAPQGWADDETAKKVLKDGLLGAGVGAVSSAASGGKAGKGALIGAGTNIVGGAVIDLLTGSSSRPSEPAPGYPQPQPTYTPPPQPVYAQPVAAYPPAPSGSDYQSGYQKGYQEGFQQGFQQGVQQGRSGK